uniref:Uncharacterized protein n=1 Tax=Trichogramma kaykai TaxID=54128 RepID=A0ABD2W9Z4_9HYME
MQGICGLREKFMSEDFQLIKEYLTFNKPIKTGINKLQAENNIYYGYFLPTLLIIRQRWQELLQDGSEVELSTTVLEQMIDKLESRFADIFAIKNQGEIAAMAALTHPEFKCEWLSCIGKSEHEKVKEIIRKAIPAEQVNTVKQTLPRNKNTFFQFDADAARKILQTEFIPQLKDETELMQFLHEESRDLELLHNYPKIEEQRIVALFGHCSLGNKKPSELFAELQVLARSSVPTKTVLLLWYSKLPHTIDVHLDEEMLWLDAAKATEKADRISERLKSDPLCIAAFTSRSENISATSHCEISAVDQ